MNNKDDMTHQYMRSILLPELMNNRSRSCSHPHPIKAQTDENAHLNKLENLIRSTYELSRRTAERMEPMTEALAAQKEQLERHSSLLERGNDLTQSVLGKTNNLLKITSNIKSITTETLKGVRSIRGKISSGDPSIFRELMMNEWFMLILVFLAHPHFPITMESIGIIFSIIFGLHYITRTTRLIARREFTLFEAGAGPMKLLFNLFTSAPHAIFLLFFIAERWNSERLRSTAQLGGPRNITAYQQAFSENNLENLFLVWMNDSIQSVRDFMEFDAANRFTYQDFFESEANIIMALPANLERVPRNFTCISTPLPIPAPGYPAWLYVHLGAQDTVAYFQGILTYILSHHQDLIRQLRAMDPDGHLFETTPGFINLLARYTANTVATGMVDVGQSIIRAPSYLYQARSIMETDLYILTLTGSFVNSIFGGIFSEFIYYTRRVSCQQLIQLQTYLTPIENTTESTGWFSMPTVASIANMPQRLTVSAARTVMDFIASRMTCDVPS